jgi:CBS domain-containing protein
VASSRYRFAFVASPGRTLFGRLRRAALEGDDGLSAEAVMEPGPSTIRPDTALEALAERMRRADLACLPVTTPEGELLGIVRRDDLEAELGGAGQ